MNIRWTFFL